MSHIRSFSISILIRAGLALTLAVIFAPPAALAARWIQVENQYFTALSNASKKKTLAVLRELEKFRVTVQTVTVGRIPEDAAKIPIVLIGSRSEFFRQYAPARGVIGYAVPIKDRSLLVMPAINASLSTMMIVRHEYVHAFLRTQNRRYPKWLEEGIAELLATTIIHDDTFDYGASSSNRSIAFDEDVSLDLIIQNMEDPHATDEYALYRVLAHFFLIGNDRYYVPNLEEYLAALAAGEDSVEAFEQAFGMSADALWRDEILDYSKDMPYFTLPYDPGLMDTEFTITDAPEEKVSASLAFLAAHVGRPKSEEVSRAAVDQLAGLWQKHLYEQNCVENLVGVRFSEGRKSLTIETPDSRSIESEQRVTSLRGFDIKRMGRRTITLNEKFPTAARQAADSYTLELRILSDTRFCLRQPDWPEQLCTPSYVRCAD